jgi:hypothetical protein
MVFYSFQKLKVVFVDSFVVVSCATTLVQNENTIAVKTGIRSPF